MWMELSVLHSGNRVRITAELIDARTDQHLWGQSYERDLSDVLMLQSEMAQAIALQVRLKLTPEEQARLQQGLGVNPEAVAKRLLRRVEWSRH
jgi:adenylate cyclase